MKTGHRPCSILVLFTIIYTTHSQLPAQQNPNQFGPQDPNQFPQQNPNQFGPQDPNNQFGQQNPNQFNPQDPNQQFNPLDPNQQNPNLFPQNDVDQFGNPITRDQFGNPVDEFGNPITTTNFNIGRNPALGGINSGFGANQFDPNLFNPNPFGLPGVGPFGQNQFGTQFGQNEMPEGNMINQLAVQNYQGGGACTRPTYRDFASYSVYNGAAQFSRQDMEPGCQPLVMYMVARHQIRNPTLAQIHVLTQKLTDVKNRLASQRQGELCAEDYNRIINWHFRIDDREAELLTDIGYRAAYDLGFRYRQMFPTLFSHYEPNRYLFAHIYQNATWNTATAFAHGMFNRTDIVHPTLPLGIARSVLSFNRDCDRQDYRDDVEEEIDEFWESIPGQTMKDQVTRRLGFIQGGLSEDHIDAMYQMCAIDQALFEDAPWCSVFDDTNLSLLEFKEDVVAYQKFGPGDDVNGDMTCMLMKNFYEKVDTQGTFNPQGGNVGGGQKGIFLFADGDAVVPFMNKLGLFDEWDDVESDDMEEQGTQRMWRMSRINPIGSNMAVVLFQCQDELKLKVLVNEIPQIVSPCTTPLCSLREIIGLDDEDWAEECDLDEICGATWATFSYLTISLSLIFALHQLFL